MVLIDDFSREDGRSALGTEWRCFTDQVMGGVSRGGASRDTRAGLPCLRLRGEVSLENNGGFIQAALPLDTSRRLFDASGYEGIRLTDDRENVRARLLAANADIVKLTNGEHGKAGTVGMLQVTLQGTEQTLASLDSRLDTALAPVFHNWQHQVTTSSETFLEICSSLVNDWRECRTRFEATAADISRLEVDLEGKRATLKALETAIEETKKRHADKNDELRTQ